MGTRMRDTLKRIAHDASVIAGGLCLGPWFVGIFLPENVPVRLFLTAVFPVFYASTLAFIALSDFEQAPQEKQKPRQEEEARQEVIP